MAVFMTVFQTWRHLYGSKPRPQRSPLSHGSLSTTDILYNPIGYSLKEETGRIDYDEMEELALEAQTKLLVAGASAYAREWDYERMHE